MRKIIVGEFISLDGVVEAPETWHFPYVNDEMFAAMWALNERCDTMLLGRVTYESFAGAFADAAEDDAVAAQMNRPAKVVVSSTLQDPAWRNSTVLTGDVVAGVAALKERPGRDILTTGSVSLVQTLLGAGLVDELSLIVHPIVLGKGRRLFAAANETIGDDAGQLPLRLARSTTFGTGVVHLVYDKA